MAGNQDALIKYLNICHPNYLVYKLNFNMRISSNEG